MSAPQLTTADLTYDDGFDDGLHGRKSQLRYAELDETRPLNDAYHEGYVDGRMEREQERNG